MFLKLRSQINQHSYYVFLLLICISVFTLGYSVLFSHSNVGIVREGLNEENKQKITDVLNSNILFYDKISQIRDIGKGDTKFIKELKPLEETVKSYILKVKENIESDLSRNQKIRQSKDVTTENNKMRNVIKMITDNYENPSVFYGNLLNYLGKTNPLKNNEHYILLKASEAPINKELIKFTEKFKKDNIVVPVEQVAFKKYVVKNTTPVSYVTPRNYQSGVYVPVRGSANKKYSGYRVNTGTSR